MALVAVATAPQVPRGHAALYDELVDRLDRFRVSLPASPPRGDAYFFAGLDYDRYASASPGALLRESDRQAAGQHPGKRAERHRQACSRIATQR